MIQDLYSAIEIWSEAWSENLFVESLDDTPLGKVVDWGHLPYGSPYGINWAEPDEDNGRDAEVWPEHYETQESILRKMSEAVKNDVLLNPDNMVILVDLNYDVEYNNGDGAIVIFPSKNGKLFYASKFGAMSKFDKSNKSLQATKSFYYSLKEAKRYDTFPTTDYKEVYSEWTGWLDNSGDFYGNYSHLLSDAVMEFDTKDPDNNLTFENDDESDFTKVWIVVKKSFLLPMIINWNKESAQQLWNLLSR